MDYKSLKSRIEQAKAEGEEFDEALLAELGLMMKALPKAERDWDWLASQVGWDGTGKSLWHSINRLLSEASRAFDSDARAQYRALEKAKQKIRDERNEYNRRIRDEARRRVGRIVSEAIRLCRLHSVSALHILNLGDMIEGLINASARIQQTIDVAEQVILAAELMAEAVSALKAAAPRVTYRSCTDNHTRMVADKRQSIEREQFSRIISAFVEERLKGSGVEFPRDNLDPGLGMFSLADGTSVAFFHGHEGSKKNQLQDVVGATRKWVDVVCCGHWHSPSESTQQGMRVFVNGSLCGTGPYALRMRLFCKPSQKLLIAEPGSIADVDIAAEAPAKPKRGRGRPKKEARIGADEGGK